MRDVLHDLRYALRILARSPGFAGVVLLALALGIGANTAIFTYVNAYLLRPLPFHEPGRLVIVTQFHREKNLGGSVAFPDYLDWRQQSSAFEEMTAIRSGSFNLTGVQEPEWMLGMRASATFFATLGVKPALGRGFLPEEDSPGKNRVVVLSHSLWQRRFAGSPAVLGQVIRLNQEPHTVVGVMPRGFRFGNAPNELWAPLGLDTSTAGRGNQFLQVIARLKPGVTLQRAQSEISTIADRLAGEYPNSNAGWGAQVEDLRERFVKRARPAVLVLMAAVALVLLIACANVANLLLARAAARQKEVAIRATLGAGRWRIVRQMLTESVVLAMAGGALGLVLAVWGVQALNAAMPARMQPVEPPRLDGMVLGFAALVSLLTGVAFGLAPALSVSRADLHETLKEGGRGSAAGVRHGRLRGALIVSEVALAIILLTGAGLLVKSFALLLAVDPGFRSENVLKLGVPLPEAKYAEPRQWSQFYQQVLERVRALPGVRYAAASNLLPMSGSNTNWSFTIEGRPEPPPGQFALAGYRVVTPEYFRAMGIPLVRGRQFTEQDREGAPWVVIINETMASRYWPNEDPLGKRIKAGRQTEWATVVGLVANVKYFGLDGQAWPEMFWSQWQRPQAGMNLVIRTASDPAALSSGVLAAIRQVDPDQPVAGVQTMEKTVSDSLAPQRLTMLLLGTFAALALVLAGVGLYGVMSYLVAQRSHEIGVRMALGAERGDVLRLVVGQGMALCALGVTIGLAGAFALTRLMASLLFGVTARDPAIFASVPLVLAAVALAATSVPARRAACLDPVVALRYE